MMTFSKEVNQKIDKAIETFVKIFGGSFVKVIQSNDTLFKIMDHLNIPIAYADVQVRNRYIRDAYPLPIDVKRLNRLMDKRLNPVIVWHCDDGIIYAKLEKLRGDIMLSQEKELMAFYEKQKAMKYVRFT
jgi:hypothetical protein